MTAHPAVPILAAHEVARWSRQGTLAHCTCGTLVDCTTAGDEYPAHLTDMLQQAGLLAPATPPETPTERVLAECRYCGQGWVFPAGTRQGMDEVRAHEAHCTADRRTPCCNAHHFEGCADGEPGCCPRCPINPWPAERADRRTT